MLNKHKGRKRLEDVVGFEKIYKNCSAELIVWSVLRTAVQNLSFAIKYIEMEENTTYNKGYYDGRASESIEIIMKFVPRQMKVRIESRSKTRLQELRMYEQYAKWLVSQL